MCIQFSQGKIAYKLSLGKLYAIWIIKMCKQNIKNKMFLTLCRKSVCKFAATICIHFLQKGVFAIIFGKFACKLKCVICM